MYFKYCPILSIAWVAGESWPVNSYRFIDMTICFNSKASIEVRGPNVFKGYWKMPEKTAEELREDGFFITGDLGQIDEQGYVSIVGRDKDLIITGGLNVYPAEVESVLDSIKGVKESALIGLPHEDFGEAVTAIVAGIEDEFLNEDNIKKILSEKLAKFKVPKKVIFVNSLMRNTMGKIQKKAMRDKYDGLYTTF